MFCCLKRPVIHINYEEKNHFNNDFLLHSVEEEFKTIFGNSIEIDRLDELSGLINKLINSNTDLENKVNLFTEKHLSNVGYSSKFAAEYLVSKLN